MIELAGIVLLLSGLGMLCWLVGRQPKELWQKQGRRLVQSVDGNWRIQYLRSIEPKLERAGISKKDAQQFFVGQMIRTGSALAGGLALVFMGMPPILLFVAPAVAFFLPLMSLNSKIRKRQRAISFALPYYLDLLTLAMEAGLDLIAAMEEVVHKDRSNPLQQELLITLASVQMGTVRSTAFAQMAERTGVDSLSVMASAITQSEELGSSLGGILRLQAESVRRQIFRDAEVAAQKAPMKMLLPLIGLIFPIVFVLLFAPIAIQMLR